MELKEVNEMQVTDGIRALRKVLELVGDEMAREGGIGARLMSST